MPDDATKLTVLWATDGSHQAENAVPLLKEMVLPVAKRVVVLTVAPHAFFGGARPDPAFVAKVTRRARARAVLEAHQAAERAALALDPEVSVDVSARWGHPIQEILRAANAARADLIVMAAKGHTNLRLLLLGSVSQGVAQLTTRPLLIARPGLPGGQAGAKSVGTVLVGYHGSGAARKALAFLSRLALPAAARVVLVNVIEPFTIPEGTPVSYRRQALSEAHKINERRHRDAARALKALAEQIGAAGRQATYEVLAGDAAPQLDAAARKHHADLIVVGSRRPSAARHYLLGSTAEKLVRHAHTSVLIVR